MQWLYIISNYENCIKLLKCSVANNCLVKDVVVTASLECWNIRLSRSFPQLPLDAKLLEAIFIRASPLPADCDHSHQLPRASKQQTWECILWIWLWWRYWLWATRLCQDAIKNTLSSIRCVKEILILGKTTVWELVNHCYLRSISEYPTMEPSHHPSHHPSLQVSWILLAHQAWNYVIACDAMAVCTDETNTVFTIIISSQ